MWWYTRNTQRSRLTTQRTQKLMQLCIFCTISLYRVSEEKWLNFEGRSFSCYWLFFKTVFRKGTFKPYIFDIYNLWIIRPSIKCSNFSSKLSQFFEKYHQKIWKTIKNDSTSKSYHFVAIGFITKRFSIKCILTILFSRDIIDFIISCN